MAIRGEQRGCKKEAGGSRGAASRRQGGAEGLQGGGRGEQRGCKEEADLAHFEVNGEQQGVGCAWISLERPEPPNPPKESGSSTLNPSSPKSDPEPLNVERDG